MFVDFREVMSQIYSQKVSFMSNTAARLIYIDFDSHRPRSGLVSTAYKVDATKLRP
jgi:hypothetical protein